MQKQKSISQIAKKLANAAGVKTRIRTAGNVYVTFLSEPPTELVAQIEALSTQEAHGDLIDDTRWYSGQGVSVSFEYEIPAESMARFEAIKARFADHGHWFKQAVIEEMGAAGRGILTQVRL